MTDSATGAARQYTYDLNGNRTGLSETFADDKVGNTTFMGSKIGYTSKVTSYTYSPTNELVSTQENYSVTGGNVERITHYEYDNVGNEVSSRVNYATNGDINFGVTDKNNWGVIDYCIEYTVNEYDGLNRLVHVSSVKNSNNEEASYTYNGDGLRFSSTVKGISTNYQNETKFYHYNGSKLMNITRNALQSSSGKISYIPSLTGYTGFKENGETLVYTKNAHGDVNATVNATGNVVDLYTYDEFGNVDYLQKTTDNRILYASQYLDTETGNYYLKARYYNPNIGRFTQRDPHWTPSNMIYGDISESAPEPDIRSSDYAVYVPTPIQRNAMTLPTDNQQTDDKVRGIIAETMAFSESITYNGNLYDSYFASFGNTEEALFSAIVARQANNGAILQSINLYVYCTNNPVMFVDPWGLKIEMSIRDYELFQNYCEDIFGYDVEFEYTTDNKGKNVTITGVVNYAEEGGSLTGKSLITFLAGLKTNIKFEFDNSVNSGNSYIYSHVSIAQARKSIGEYIENNGISIEEGSEQYEKLVDQEVESHIIHELTHVYTNLMMYDKKVSQSVSEDEPNHYKLVRKYQEAAAITVEQRFRQEIGHLDRNSITDLVLEMNGYGYWPWYSRNRKCDLYGTSFIKPTITLMQGPFIYYDIIRNNIAQMNKNSDAETE